jgi:hypothetical protein
VIAHIFLRGLPRPVIRWTGPRTAEVDVYLEEGEEVTKKFADGGEVKVTFRELREREGAPLHVCCGTKLDERSDRRTPSVVTSQ